MIIAPLLLAPPAGLSRITVVLVTGAGAIWALIGAALMISTSACICAALTIERQQRLRDPRLGFWFVVEVRDQTFHDLAHVDIHVGLHRDGNSAMAGEPRAASLTIALDEARLRQFVRWR